MERLRPTAAGGQRASLGEHQPHAFPLCCQQDGNQDMQIFFAVLEPWVGALDLGEKRTLLGTDFSEEKFCKPREKDLYISKMILIKVHLLALFRSQRTVCPLNQRSLCIRFLKKGPSVVHTFQVVCCLRSPAAWSSYCSYSALTAYSGRWARGLLGRAPASCISPGDEGYLSFRPWVG